MADCITNVRAALAGSEAARAELEKLPGAAAATESLVGEIIAFASRRRRAYERQGIENVAEAVARDMRIEGEKRLLEAQNAKRAQAMNLLKKAERNRIYERFGAERQADAMQAVLTGIQDNVQGARLGTAQKMDALRQNLTGSLYQDLKRGGLFEALRNADDSLVRDIMREREALNKDSGEAPGLTGNKAARSVAEIVKKHQDIARNLKNAEGALVGENPRYIMAQEWDSYRMNRGSKAQRDEYRAGFVDDAMARTDWDMAFDGQFKGLTPETATADDLADMRGALESYYDAYSSGIHMGFSDEDPVGYAFQGPRNKAKSLSQRRVLVLKDADATFEMVQKYGASDFPAQIFSELDRAARDIALMRDWGTNPRAAFEDDLRRLAEGDRRSLQAAKLTPNGGLLDAIWREIDGSVNSPVSHFWARFMANTRAVITMAKLGGMLLSQFTDTATYASSVRRQGSPALAGMAESIANLTRGMAPEDSALFRMEAGAIMDGLLGDINARFSIDTGLGRGMTKYMNLFMKMTGAQWWDNAQRSGAIQGFSARLAGVSGQGWGQMGETMQRLLSKYDFDAPRWEALRSAPLDTVNGRQYLTDRGIEQISDDAIKAMLGKPDASAATVARERNKLLRDFGAMMADQASEMVLQPGALERAILKQGLRPGTFGGEVARSVTQFKSFTATYINRVIGRELYASGSVDYAGLAGVVLASSVIGGGVFYLKQYAKGRDPSDMTNKMIEGDAETIAKFGAAAMSQGGGLGVLGDVLFADYRKFGGGLGDVLLGPLAGSASDLVGVLVNGTLGQAKGDVKFKTVLADAFKVVRENTPFNNLFYTKPAWDYLLTYRLQEAINPGYLRRMEQRMKKDDGITFMFPPSEYATGLPF